MIERLFGQTRPSETHSLRLTYQLNCLWCSTINAGLRSRQTHQIECINCRRKLYIGPISPLVGVAGLRYPSRSSETQSEIKPSEPVRSWPLWAGPLLAATLTLVGSTVAVAILFGWFGGGQNQTETPSLTAEEWYMQGKSALEEGSHQLALHAFRQAKLAHQQTPLPTDKARRLEQLTKQVELLTLLLEEPLQQILRNSLGVRPDEWRRTFDQRYAGKTILFDAFVRRESNGEYTMKMPLFAGKSKAKVDLRTLRVLRDLPLNRGTRLLFGAKLTNIREDREYRLVQFDPDSGVLITHPEVLIGTSVLVDDQLKAVIAQQAKWVGAN